MNRPINPKYDLVTVARHEADLSQLATTVRQFNEEHDAKRQAVRDDCARDVSDRYEQFAEMLRLQTHALNESYIYVIRQMGLMKEDLRKLQDRTLPGRYRQAMRWLRWLFWMARGILGRGGNDA